MSAKNIFHKNYNSFNFPNFLQNPFQKWSPPKTIATQISPPDLTGRLSGPGWFYIFSSKLNVYSKFIYLFT